MNIPELIKKAYDDAKQRGFYRCKECGGEGYAPIMPDGEPGCCPTCTGTSIDPNIPISTLLMDIIKEIMEARRAFREGKRADWKYFDQAFDGLNCFTWQDEKASTSIPFGKVMFFPEKSKK